MVTKALEEDENEAKVYINSSFETPESQLFLG